VCVFGHGFRFLLQHVGVTIAPPLTLDGHRVERHLDLAFQVVKTLDACRGVLQNTLFTDADSPFMGLASGVQKLNVVLAYLREVHVFCFYCARLFVDAEQMLECCGQAHLRQNAAMAAPSEPSMEDQV